MCAKLAREPDEGNAMKFLILQHISIEHPGVFRDFMRAGGVAWDAVELDAGEAIPALDGYDALISMGGPMDVFDEAEHPWLKDEKAIIREAVRERDMPFLGFCLGHQLLADALDGEVARMVVPEVGLMEVSLTPAGRADPLFAGLDGPLDCLQWHGCEVSRAPTGGEFLAASGICPAQAMRVGRHAYGLQFHVEMTTETVTEWGAIPAYEQSLETALGTGALARLDADIAAILPKFNATAERIYENFIALLK